MSIPDWLSIVSSVLSIIAFILGLFTLKNKSNNTTYSYRESVNVNYYQSCNTQKNNDQQDANKNTDTGYYTLAFIIFSILWGNKIERYMVYILAIISITGILAVLWVRIGKDIYFPSEKRWDIVLFLFSPFLIVSLYPLSSYFLNNNTYGLFSQELEMNLFFVVHGVNTIFFVFSAAILLTVQISAILIPLTKGVVQKVLIKVMRLWKTPAMIGLIGLFITIIPYLHFSIN